MSNKLSKLVSDILKVKRREITADLSSLGEINLYLNKGIVNKVAIEVANILSDGRKRGAKEISDELISSLGPSVIPTVGKLITFLRINSHLFKVIKSQTKGDYYILKG